MPRWISSATGSVARRRRKPSLLGSVEALPQDWRWLTGQSCAGVHVRDLHDPQTAPIRFHPDLQAGSGWNRNIACALEHGEVKKGLRSRAVQRHEAELLGEAEPTHPRAPDHCRNLSCAQASSGRLLAQVEVSGIELTCLSKPVPVEHRERAVSQGDQPLAPEFL